MGCILEQDTSLPVHLATEEYWQIKSRGLTPCDGVAFCPGRSRNTPAHVMIVALCYRKQS